MYRAAALVSHQRIVIEKREEFELSENEVLIKVRFAGVCGMDIALFSGRYKVPLPIVLGHEFSGEIIEVGRRVEKELMGKWVVGEINNTCLAYRKEDLCEFCKRGLSSHCSRRTIYLILPLKDGSKKQWLLQPRHLRFLLGCRVGAGMGACPCNFYL